MKTNTIEEAKKFINSEENISKNLMEIMVAYANQYSTPQEGRGRYVDDAGRLFDENADAAKLMTRDRFIRTITDLPEAKPPGELIKEKHPSYDPLWATKDFLLSGKQIEELMIAYAKQHQIFTSPPEMEREKKVWEQL